MDGESTENILSSHHKTAMKIASRPENKTCADCKAPRPEWASINLGIFICIECSGVHRSFGSHISQVRSVKLDKWDEESLVHIDKIGNSKANEYWEYNIPPKFERDLDNFAKFVDHKKTEILLFILSFFRQRKRWLTLKYVEKRFTKDWVEPSNDSEETKRQLAQQKRLEELRSAALDIRKRLYFTFSFFVL